MKKLNAKGIFLGANAFGIIEKLEGENATDFLTYIREHMNREDCCVCWRHTLATFRGDFKQFLVFVRMFEDLVSNLLSTYLGDYLEALSKYDLKISLWKGDVDFKNLVSGASCALCVASEGGRTGVFESAHPGERGIRWETVLESVLPFFDVIC